MIINGILIRLRRLICSLRYICIKEIPTVIVLLPAVEIRPKVLRQWIWPNLGWFEVSFISTALQRKLAPSESVAMRGILQQTPSNDAGLP